MKINNKYTKVIKETFNKCTDLRNNPHFQKILKDYKSLKDVTEYYNKKGDTLIKKNKTKKQDYEKSILFQIGIVVHREQEEKRKLEENKEKDKKEIKAKGKNINKEEEKQEEMENQEEQEDLKLSLDQSVLISNKLNKNGGKFKNPINKNRDTYFNNFNSIAEEQIAPIVSNSYNEEYFNDEEYYKQNLFTEECELSLFELEDKNSLLKSIDEFSQYIQMKNTKSLLDDIPELYEYSASVFQKKMKRDCFLNEKIHLLSDSFKRKYIFSFHSNFQLP